MATTPRGKSNARRATSRSKKPATIDLDAKDVKDNSTSDTGSVTNNDGKKPIPVSSSAKSSPPNQATKTQVSDAGSPKKSDTPQQKKTSPSVPSVDPKKVEKTSSVNKFEEKPKTSEKEPSKSSATKPAGATSKKPKHPNNSGGFGKLAAAGIIGGLITLGGAGAMQYSGMLQGLGNGEPANPAPLVDLSPLEEKLAAMQSKIDQLETATAQPNSDAGSKPVDLSTIKERIAALENAPAPVSGDGGGITVGEITKLQTAYDDLTSKSEILASRLSTLETSEPVQTDTSTITSLINSAIAPISNSAKQTGSKIEQVEGKIASLTKKIDEEVDARINAFDEKLKNAATGEKLAKSVAINALKSAVENGQPFSAALTSLETLAGSSKPLEKLKPFADNGIATNKQLLDEFHNIQGSILAAASNDPDASISDRLMLSLQSLVTISSDEALPGGSPEAVISRIDANLKSDNFGAAISEWKTLPDPAQQLSKAWIDKLDQRMDADRQMYKLMKSLQATN